jgi:flagellar motor switch/type III secretory pathway protein FliN
MRQDLFLLRGTKDLALVEAAAEKKVGAWQEKWLPQSSQTNVNCTSADGLLSKYKLSANSGWMEYKADNDKSIWVPATAVHATQVILFNDKRGLAAKQEQRSLAPEIAEEALRDLLRTIVQSANVSSLQDAVAESQPGNLFRQGSGAVVLHIQIGEILFPAVLNAHLANEFIPKIKPPMKAKPNALLGNPLVSMQAYTVDFVVYAGEAEFELGALKSLAIGDVIQLGTRLDQPLELRIKNGKRLCDGYLGVSAGHKAVELANSANTMGV